MAQVATTPKAVDLTSRVQAAGYDWNDFPPGERDVFTVDGKVLRRAGARRQPRRRLQQDAVRGGRARRADGDWTWDELVVRGHEADRPAKKQFGLVFPIDGSETEVWQYIAMLWEAGGDLLTADGKKTAFSSPQGVTALTALQQLAQAKTLYLDPTPDSPKAPELFNANKIGMFITGPWGLSDFPDAKYGVQVMPSFPGGSHETIAGPDAWVVIDNGKDRVDAAWTFLQWLTEPQQVLADSLETGHLPTRSSVSTMPAFAPFATKFPGVDVFVQNLANVKKARPSIATYPQISQQLGQAVTSVLLGKSSPQDALANAAKQSDSILATAVGPWA